MLRAGIWDIMLCDLDLNLDLDLVYHKMGLDVGS